tara:strand:- start:24 stop:353 length:330 start_codon:yes stop_codon:yes gene_type:complete
MASDDEYDSMEELSNIEKMGQKLENEIEGISAKTSKGKSAKAKSKDVSNSTDTTEQKIEQRKAHIACNEVKIMALDVSIQKIKTNISKCLYALAKIDPELPEIIRHNVS